MHVVWGFSKDFGVAGWRVGVLYPCPPARVPAPSLIKETPRGMKVTFHEAVLSELTKLFL